MSALLKLAELCEKAAGPDRKIDTAIAYHMDEAGALVDFETDENGLIIPAKYTASLDAAMSLVPEGYDWIIGRTNDGLTIHAEVGGRGDEFMRFGNTPALALCAAALRAAASRIDARRGETVKQGSIGEADESLVGATSAETPNLSSPSQGEGE